MTPFTGMQRTVQTALDPTVRQPKGFAESFAASVPGLSSSVPARIDRFGEDIQRPGNALARAADPFNTSPAAGDAVAVELQRLGVEFNPPSARIDLQPGPAEGRELSREEQTRVRKAGGQAIKRQLQALIGNSAYQRMPDDRKRAALARAIERARTRATTQLRRELPR